MSDVAPQPPVLEHDWFPRPLPANVVLGPRSWFYSSYAFLHYRSRRPVGLKVGHDTGIYINTHFDVGPDGEVEIGDYCTLAGPTIATNARVTIGSHVLVSHDVFIADTPFAVPPGKGGRAAAPTARSHIVIGDNAWIGTRAVLLAGTRLGEGAIVGAAAVVTIEVPPFAIVAGNPAKIVGWARPHAQIERRPA